MNPQSFGRAMMAHSGNMPSDKDCNDFARVGNKLINIGEPGFPKTIYDLSSEDMEIISKALMIVKTVNA